MKKNQRRRTRKRRTTPQFGSGTPTEPRRASTPTTQERASTPRVPAVSEVPAEGVPAEDPPSSGFIWTR
jgi:hypothetical protein